MLTSDNMKPKGASAKSTSENVACSRRRGRVAIPPLPTYEINGKVVNLFMALKEFGFKGAGYVNFHLYGETQWRFMSCQQRQNLVLRAKTYIERNRQQDQLVRLGEGNIESGSSSRIIPEAEVQGQDLKETISKDGELSPPCQRTPAESSIQSHMGVLEEVDDAGVPVCQGKILNVLT